MENESTKLKERYSNIYWTLRVNHENWKVDKQVIYVDRKVFFIYLKKEVV